MVKIIIPGKIPIETRTFKCHNCGCVFEADRNDYHLEEDIICITYYSICPCCKKKVVFEERIE